MLKRPAVFFDRDNTLIVSDGYLGDPTKVVLVDGAADAVAKARQYGFRVVTFSNQSGVARGLFDEDAVRAVDRRMDELLATANPAAKIEAHEFCPFHPEAKLDQYRQDSPLRKPKPGMLLEAAARLSLDLSRSWVVGDAPRDIEAGKAAGCHTVLFKDPKLPPSPATEQTTEATADFTVSSLRQAVELIGKEAFRRPMEKVRAAAHVEAPVGENAAPPAAPTTPEPTSDPEPPEPPPATRQASTDDTPPAAPKPEPQPEDWSDLPPVPQKDPGQRMGSSRTEILLSQILTELKRHRDDSASDFSVTRLLAVIAQVLALASVFVALMSLHGPMMLPFMLAGLFAQTLTIALLLMTRR